MSYQLLVTKRQALDEQWHHKLSAILENLPEVYDQLQPSVEELSHLHQAFTASNYTKNIDLRIDIDTSHYTEVNKQLEDLKIEVAQSIDDEVILKAYTDRIDELIMHHNVLLAASRHDTRAFHAYNRQLYGEPDHAIFAACCAWLRQLAKQSLGSEAHDIAKKVLKKIPNIDGDIESILPDKKTFRAVRELHFAPGGYVDALFNGVVVPERVTEANGTPIVKKVLENLSSDYKLQAAPVFWGVSHAAKTVYYAAGYDLSRSEFCGIIAHELGSHLLERINGSRQPLQLLATGLNQYERCNEGRAYLREQIFYEDIKQALVEPSWEHIITMHLAISLACGLHDHVYTFAEVYDVLYVTGLLLALHRSEALDQAQEKAHKQAWITTVRTLKGTDGTGGAYLKDIVYLEANSKCWSAAKEDPSIILLGDLGKFDLFREDHLGLLRDLSIIG